MLGVRRLLGGGVSPDRSDAVVSPPPLPATSNEPRSATPSDVDAPALRPNWPPRAPSPIKPVSSDFPLPPATQYGSPPASPGTTRAGMFRKDGRARSRTRRATQDMDDATGDNSTLPTRRSSSRQSPSSGWRSPDSTKSPPIVRSPLPAMPPPFSGRSGPIATTAPLRPAVSLTAPAPIRTPSPSRNPSNPLSPDWKHSSSLLDTNDEMLMSLLASQAVVDSRECQILSAEEVDELKREYQILTTRLKALRQKLSTEIKIRNAAESLAKLHASHKRMSRHTSEQLDAAVRKVEAAEKEVTKVSDRVGEVGRRLGEHRAGVLSFSLTLLEKKLGLAGVDAFEDEEGSNAETSFSDATTPSTAATSVSSTGTPRNKFAGPHLFSGNADAVLPGVARPLLTPAAMAALEDRLKSANDTIESLRKREGDLTRELETVSMDRAEVETTLSMQLHAAEENVMGMEKELTRLENVEEALKSLEDEREQWEQERATLEGRSGELEDEIRKARFSRSRDPELEKKIEETSKVLKQKEEAWEYEQTAWEEERKRWTDVRAKWEVERAEWSKRVRQKDEEAAELQKGFSDLRDSFSNAALRREELETVRERLLQLVRSHAVALDGEESALNAVAALSAHMDQQRAQRETHLYQKTEWEADRRRLQEELVDVRVKMSRETDEARKETDQVRQDLGRKLQEHTRRPSDAAPSEHVMAVSDLEREHLRVLNVLQELWSLLPSAEARAGKLGRTKATTPSSSASSPTTPRTHETGHSLSELDVRALKILYDPKSGFASPMSADSFSVDSFASRTKALISDDRALMERLIRFAQAHDLLRANAERSQRLAQEGRVGMETYQKQVRQLEERISGTVAREASLVAEITDLHRAVEEARAEKRELEAEVARQTETCQSLSDANKTLSARTLTLAAEAASAPQMARSKVEAQVGELKRALQEAQDEVDSLRNVEQSQRIALLDELNAVQKENATLRDQLRAKGR